MEVFFANLAECIVPITVFLCFLLVALVLRIFAGFVDRAGNERELKKRIETLEADNKNLRSLNDSYYSLLKSCQKRS